MPKTACSVISKNYKKLHKFLLLGISVWLSPVLIISVVAVHDNELWLFQSYVIWHFFEGIHQTLYASLNPCVWRSFVGSHSKRTKVTHYYCTICIGSVRSSERYQRVACEKTRFFSQVTYQWMWCHGVYSCNLMCSYTSRSNGQV